MKDSNKMQKLIGERLKNLRIKNGYTQKQVSDYLGIDQSNLSKIERGERNFSITLFEKLSFLYNCSHEYVMGDSDDYELPKIAFSTKDNADLSVVADINKTMQYLKILRKRDKVE